MMRRTICFAAGLMLSLVLSATAQESRSEVGLQANGFFTKSTSANGTAYDAAQTGGFLGSYRYHLNRWLSAEGAYGIDRNSQKFSVNNADFRVQSDIHQATAGLVFGLPSVARRRFSPYFLAGGGALIFDPTANTSNTITASQTQTKGVFIYGAGLNYPLFSRVSLRAEYRGLVYSTPDFGFSSLRTNTVTHPAQPSVGLAFHF